MNKLQVTRVVRKVGDESVRAGRGPSQLAWYEFAAPLVTNKTVLDAGCGLGLGLDILKRSAKKVIGQDLDERLSHPNITITTLDKIADKSFDVVTSIDVVEHVEDDLDFVRQLARIAREFIFITTPNWTVTRCHWPYHVREYTPKQLEALLGTVGEVTLYKGNSRGTVIHRVQYNSAYHVLNKLRIWPVTGFATRCVSHFLPSALKLHGHNAALVHIR